MENKKPRKENVQILKKFSQLFMSATFSSYNIFCVYGTLLGEDYMTIKSASNMLKTWNSLWKYETCRVRVSTIQLVPLVFTAAKGQFSE